MRRPARLLPVLPAVAATALLLTSCGTQHTASGTSGTATASPTTTGAGTGTGTQVDDPGKDGVRVVSVTLPSASPSPSRTASVMADSLDSGASAIFEITNDGTEALTYTVIVTFQSADGGAVDNRTTTVRDVGPGKTVRGTVRTQSLPSSAPRITGAEVMEVTKVPAAEAPAAPGACPPSGIRVSADRGDAAMGLRVVGLHLENCGTRDYTVNGYPLLELLDEDHKPIDGIRILKGGGEISTAFSSAEPPRPVTLKPGESATSALVWRNTTGFGTAVNAPYVRVRAKSGAAPVTVTPNLDLGTTGKLGVDPWKKADDGRP
ncbi:DUF4232 domain-containing protein [Streptomyces sp. VRA16 Mangrove soil]|uniref:DUF4232 domain-containing protein n=1 Tax=Streptomyces sp. VRA16 Mangrove soil TaxID=2817434 RepID=UPI001A9F31DD|nr:DUF4232 domain-containing protein [Streptomyces sp. VRA16 Mangrove soil]MBO1334831.1 DUF4232 domain-containing protein [Streptomyces sp. VRA16 Mangrove soil]